MTGSSPVSHLIVIKEVIKGRYQPGTKPANWEDRVASREVVVSTNGESYALESSAMQSTPSPGWQILLTPEIKHPNGGVDPTYTWTLYGLSN